VTPSQLVTGALFQNLPFFSIEEDHSQERYKRFAELCIFAHYTGRSSRCGSQEHHAAILEFLEAQMEALRVESVFDNLYVAYQVVMPYVFLRERRRIDFLENALLLICEEGLRSPEVPPHRQMEWDYLLRKIGRGSPVRMPPTSILNQSCFISDFDRTLAYALTHSVFYLTDFGFATAVPPLAELDLCAFRIACLAARFCREHDLDVLLELGICYVALYPFVEDRAIANRLLADVLTLASCGVRHAGLLDANLGVNEPDSKTMKRTHHTLMVLGILIALLDVRLCEHGVSSSWVESLWGKGKGMSSEQLATTIEALSVTSALSIVEGLRRKSCSGATYACHRDEFGRSELLEREIASSLKILKRRNELEILWRDEYELLGVPRERQQQLKLETDADLERISALLTY
jgi:hypothetical protein